LLISFRPSLKFLVEANVEVDVNDLALLVPMVDVVLVVLPVATVPVAAVEITVRITVIAVAHPVAALVMMIMIVVVILLALHHVAAVPQSMTTHHHVALALMIPTVAATTRPLIHTPMVTADLDTTVPHHATTLHESLDIPIMIAIAAAVTGNYFQSEHSLSPNLL